MNDSETREYTDMELAVEQLKAARECINTMLFRIAGNETENNLGLIVGAHEHLSVAMLKIGKSLGKEN